MNELEEHEYEKLGILGLKRCYCCNVRMRRVNIWHKCRHNGKVRKLYQWGWQCPLCGRREKFGYADAI